MDNRLGLPFELLVPALCDKLCEFTRATSVKLFLRLMETIFIFICNFVIFGREESEAFIHILKK